MLLCVELNSATFLYFLQSFLKCLTWFRKARPVEEAGCILLGREKLRATLAPTLFRGTSTTYSRIYPNILHPVMLNHGARVYIHQSTTYK
jgi:hypothetical protein